MGAVYGIVKVGRWWGYKSNASIGGHGIYVAILFESFTYAEFNQLPFISSGPSQHDLY
jgi:hypothetical protein